MKQTFSNVFLFSKTLQINHLQASKKFHLNEVINFKMYRYLLRIILLIFIRTLLTNNILQ